MKIGLFATFMSPVATPQMIASFARDAESIGIESLWLGEHVVLFDEMEFPYPGSKDGKIPVPSGYCAKIFRSAAHKSTVCPLNSSWS